MPTTEASLLDYAFTYGGPSLFMTTVALLALPLVYQTFARPRFARWPARATVLLGVWLLAFVIAYADVFAIAWQARTLCKSQAGLQVYKTVEAEGFAGVSDIETWARRGFRYVESAGSDGRKWRHEMHDGTPISTEVPSFSSTIEVVSSYEPVDGSIGKERDFVREIASQAVSAELVSFRIFPGWLDRLLLAATGLSWTPPNCTGKRSAGEARTPGDATALILATIKAARN